MRILIINKQLGRIFDIQHQIIFYVCFEIKLYVGGEQKKEQTTPILLLSNFMFTLLLYVTNFIVITVFVFYLHVTYTALQRTPCEQRLENCTKLSKLGNPNSAYMCKYLEYFL